MHAFSRMTDSSAFDQIRFSQRRLWCTMKCSPQAGPPTWWCAVQQFIHSQHSSSSSSMLCGKAAPARLAAHKTPAAAAKAQHPCLTTTKNSITLTTQCSLDRWSRFLQQAESWGGPVSVAVYVPTPEGTPAAQRCLDILAQYADQHAAQHPEQQLQVSPLFAGHYAREGASVLAAAAGAALPSTPIPPNNTPIPYQHLYPINALRNLALQQASTPLVLPVDADFILSQDLQQQLHAPDPPYSILEDCTSSSRSSSSSSSDSSSSSSRSAGAVSTAAGAAEQAAVGDAGARRLSLVEQLLLNQQQQPGRPITLVLPAFQLTPQRQQQQQQQQQVQGSKQGASPLQQLFPDSQRLAVPRTKAELLTALQQGSVAPFDCGVFAPKQQPLAIAAWCAASAPLELPYADLFEVHGGVSVAQQLPPYSQAFRGYGLNKQQHAWHAAALGFRFLVLPDAFMVTAPHKRASSWRPTPGTAADAAHLQRISRVYADFKQQLEAQGLTPGGS